MKNTFTVRDNRIYIWRDGWTHLAIVDYRADYIDEIKSVTWRENNGYVYCNKFGYLHRYIMKKWYGEDLFDEMTQNGWVIDHMNNNKFDCCISNLEFLAKNYNTAKGQTTDVEIERMRHNIAVTLCKDFQTGYYQVYIGCNDRILFVNKNTGEKKPLGVLKLLYNCNYKLVINDVDRILISYSENKQFSLDSLHYCDFKADFCEMVTLKEEEYGCPIIERDGEYYFVPGNGVWLHSTSVDEGWSPPAST